LSAVDPVDLLKGRMAEALVEGIFKRAQYTVARVGHETEMPSPIRSGRRDFVPDFVVWRPLDEPSLGHHSYRLLAVEVKYRADLAGYLLNSEQAPAAVGVGVFVDVDGRVIAAGGYLVQGLPGASERVLGAVAEQIERIASPSEMVREGLGASDILRRVVGDDLALLEERGVRYRCRCSRERVAVAILAMGRQEIESVLADDRRAEVTCEFCTQRYVLEEDELRGLL